MSDRDVSGHDRKFHHDGGVDDRYHASGSGLSDRDDRDDDCKLPHVCESEVHVNGYDDGEHGLDYETHGCDRDCRGQSGCENDQTWVPRHRELHHV